MQEEFISSLLSSYILYKKLYDEKKDVYDVIAEYIKVSIITHGKRQFNSLEMKQLLKDDYNFDIPETWTFGISADVGEKGIFVADIQRINYSDIAAIANDLTPLYTQCTDALNAFLFTGSLAASGPGCGGGSNGFGFGYNDMTVVKAGYEWEYNDGLIFRAGYSVTDQPIEPQDVIFNILAPAVSKSHLTAGFTKELSSGAAITMSFMYAAGEKVTGANPFDPGQTISIDMDQYQIGFTYSSKK